MGGIAFVPGGALTGSLARELLYADRRQSLPCGVLLGPFRVVREIGRGGLGVVYLAERSDGTYAQRVALKVLDPDCRFDEAAARFDRERRILARLEHPGIARLIDGGCTTDGLVWFAMEFVEGERIDTYCRERRLGERERLGLLLHVCDAVAHAHSNLVVHRDIKPANILVDRTGQPRLLDFGIATALDDAQRSETYSSAATPGFASPEQKRGEPSGVGTDMFQLGLLLADLLHGVRTRDSRGLEAITTRALCERPDARYPNVEAFAAELRALRDLRPVSELGDRWRYRSRLFCRRRYLEVAVATVVSVLFAGTLSWYLWNLDNERRRAESAAATARSVSEFMVSVFEGADPSVHRGNPPTVRDLLEAGKARIEDELASQPQARAALQAALGRIYLSLDDRMSARKLLESSVSQGEHDPDIDAADLALRKQLLARSLPIEHASYDILNQLAQASALLDIGHGRDEQISLVDRELDIAACYEGDIEISIQRLERAVAESRGTPRERTQAFAMDLFYLGFFLSEVGRYEDAARLMREAHPQLLWMMGDGHPTPADVGSIFAMVLGRLGRSDQALELMDSSIEQTARTFGRDSARMALMIGRKGHVLHHLGRPLEAIAAYREGLLLSDRLPSDSDIDSVGILEGLGNVYYELGNPVEAKDAWLEMQRRSDEGGRSLGFDTGQRSLKLARVHAALGDCAAAASYFERATRLAADVSPLYSVHAELEEPLSNCGMDRVPISDSTHGPTSEFRMRRVQSGN